MRAHIDTNVFKHGAKSDAEFDRRKVPEKSRLWDKNQAHAVLCMIDSARQGKVILCRESEITLEVGFTTNLAEAKRCNALLAGIKMEKLEAPFRHSRIIGRTKEEATKNRDEVLDFAITHYARMREIYQATGSDGKKADAYHIWTAEVNSVDFFVTLDKKLVRSLRHQKKISLKTKVLYPAELVSLLPNTDDRS